MSKVLETKNLKEALIRKISEKELVDIVYKLRKNGISVKKISAIINDYIKSTSLTSDELDFLEDIVPALEGYCSKEYILHPENL